MPRAVADRNRVHIVDDDPDIRAMVGMILRDRGFEVGQAASADEVLDNLDGLNSDVFLLDVMMPQIDGLELCRRLRQEPHTRYSCIILVSAKAHALDKVEGLRAGADDYITKPFDPDELVERVNTALRRTRQMRAMSPLTGLPGNLEIQREVEACLREGNAVALLHIDLDHFKAYNDRYGFAQGDKAIVELATCAEDALAAVGADVSFLGHIGGDDFLALVDADRAEAVATEMIAVWDRNVKTYYESEDAARGYTEAHDREGRKRLFPLMALSIGIATTSERVSARYADLAEAAAELKGFAKQDPASSYALDRRRGGPKGALAVVTTRPIVMIVDDDVGTRFALREALAGGPEVVEAHNGMEAYFVAQEHRPAVVILDYEMPEMDGHYAADLIREAVPGAVIIAFSGILETLPAWADAYVRKGDIEALFQTLKGLGIEVG